MVKRRNWDDHGPSHLGADPLTAFPCALPGHRGALTNAGHWIPAKPGLLFPVNALSRVFRGKFIAGLKKARTDSLLHFAGEQTSLGEATAFEHCLRELSDKDWVVYAKRSFAGPQQVIDYLGRSTHRIAISNHRLIDLIDDHVCFYWRDYAHGNKREIMTLQVEEFMRRFLSQVLDRTPHEKIQFPI
jgi:Putative transposase